MPKGQKGKVAGFGVEVAVAWCWVETFVVEVAVVGCWVEVEVDVGAAREALLSDEGRG